VKKKRLETHPPIGGRKTSRSRRVRSSGYIPPVSANAQARTKWVSSVEDAATGATAAKLRRTLEERAPEQVFADAEALGHAREVPDGLDRRLADVDLDALVDVRERDRGWASLDDLSVDR
jgi:hypothetical protein